MIPASWFTNLHLLTVSSGGGKRERKQALLVSGKGTDLIVRVSPSRLHLNLTTYLLKALPSNTITLGVRSDIRVLWVHRHAVHTLSSPDFFTELIGSYTVPLDILSVCIALRIG